MALALVMLASKADAADNQLPISDLRPTDLVIYSPDGKQLIGNGHYDVEHLEGGAEILRGENHYLNGDRDVEVTRLEPAEAGALPVMAHYEHTFFRPQGTVERVVQVDSKSGKAVCSQNQSAAPVTDAATLEVPADTYAGASLLLPLENALRKTDEIRLHVFTCMPGPHIVAIRVSSVRKPRQWPFTPGDLMEVEAAPDLGWFTRLAAPFLPRIDAWFDPTNDWTNIGVTTTRYYRGPKILIVRVPQTGGAQIGKADSKDHLAPDSAPHPGW